MQALGSFFLVAVAGVFTLLGALCFVFNRKVGGWLRRFPLLVFGLKEKVAADEIIFRGLACLAGLLYAGIGLILLVQTLK
jgi:uncharacterized membrane protein